MGRRGQLPLTIPRNPFLGLDFDGTLAPIVDHPAEAALPPRTRDILEALADTLPVMILSGRALPDLRARVGLDLIYAGNHGLEISGPELEFCEPRAAALQNDLSGLCERLAVRLGHIPGVVVENKRLTASVHVRRAASEDVDRVRRIVSDAAGDSFLVRPGRMIFEVLPPVDWNKGAALRWVWQRYPATTPIYIGDDATDENAFGAIPGGITIRVGSHPATAAQHCVDGPDQVRDFLELLRTPARLRG